MWNLTSFSLEIVSVSVQVRCMVCKNVPSAQKSFWTQSMLLLGDEALVKAQSVWR
jgi:hypothetical protein